MSLEKEIEGFQRDMELLEIEHRKKLFESRLYKWLQKRKKKERKNGRT